MFKSIAGRVGLMLGVAAVPVATLAPSAHAATCAPKLAPYCQTLASFGGNFPDHDIITLQTTSAPSGFVQVQLKSAPQTTWRKELKIYGSSGNVVSQDFTQDNKHQTVTFSISEDDCAGDRLILAKAKAFGIVRNMYQVSNNLCGQLGHKLTFTWVDDD
jgi:hypothetical protein